MMHPPDLRRPRFSHTICHLRSARWAQHVGKDALRERIQDELANGITWTITPWTRNQGGAINRSYLLHSSDGAIYAIFISKRNP